MISYANINIENNTLFWKYIAERYNIYLKRKKGLPPPWTEDRLLQQYKFTNVFRDLDPGTIYVQEKILPRCANLTEAVFNIIIYRLFNKISTFEYHGIQSIKDFNQKELETRIRELSKTAKVFTNAFIVSGYATIPGKDKISKVCNIISSIHSKLPSLIKAISYNPTSQKTFEEIIKLEGIGRFLGYQICVDIGYYDKKIYDESSHVVCGPGCINGLNRLFNKPLSGKEYDEAIIFLEKIQYDEFKKISIDQEKLFSDRKNKYLNLMALENCLCEFSKYMKALKGEGRPRNKYTSKYLV